MEKEWKKPEIKDLDVEIGAVKGSLGPGPGLPMDW